MTRRDLERKYGDTRHWPLPPKDIPGRVCACGAVYMDNEPGHDSHEIVMGHRPYSAGPPTDPAGRGTTPTNHQSTAPQQPSVPDGIGRGRDPTAHPGHDDNDRDDEGE